MILVYVIDSQRKPLMPTTPVKARMLLKRGKAKVIRKMPFTIKLNYTVTTNVNPLIHGVDTGSKTIGSAVVNEKGSVLYLSEVEIRNDIADKLVITMRDCRMCESEEFRKGYAGRSRKFTRKVKLNEN